MSLTEICDPEHRPEMTRITVQKKLERREQTELAAILQQMLRQEPDLQWLLTTPLPVSGAQEVLPGPEVHRP